MRVVGVYWYDLRFLDLMNGICFINILLIVFVNGCFLLEKLDFSGCVGVFEVGFVGFV